MSKFFDNPITAQYNIANHAVDGAGTNALVLRGPPGARGRIRHLGIVIRTATTVAAALVRVGITGDLDKFASLVVPVGAALVAATATKDDLDNAYVDADTNVLINDDGVSTAGDVDISVIIDWERIGPR